MRARVLCSPHLPHREQRELRGEIEKELAARLAEKEEERERILREAEDERRRDREAVEEVRESARQVASVGRLLSRGTRG